MNRARLDELYHQKIRRQLKEQLGLENIMQVPKLNKIVLNVGSKESIADSKALIGIVATLTKIAGQQAVRTQARKSIAGFKLREGMPIGAKVTLRGRRMYEFFDRLVTFALPKVRDFQGVPTRFDGRGNYNLGIKEWTIFPEVEYEVSDKVSGLNITVETSAPNDEQARALLTQFGVPFKK